MFFLLLPFFIASLGLNQAPYLAQIPSIETSMPGLPGGVMLPGIEISPERIKVPGVEISKEKITAPGIEISTDGISTPAVEITPEKITVGGGQIVVGVGEVLIDTPRAKVKVGDSEVLLEKSGAKVAFNSGGIVVETDESVKIENGNISVITKNGQVSITVLPDDIQSSPRIKKQTIEEINLDAAEDKVVYKIKGREKRRLLGMIPVSASVDTSLNAETGTVESQKTPWWYLFTL